MKLYIEIILWVTYVLVLYFSIFRLLVLFEHKKDFNKQRRVFLKRFPFVSIIIPAYNEEESITNTLKSVIKLDYPKDMFEIIAVNDGSTDDTKKEILCFKQKHPDYSIILMDQKNQGKAKSMNDALRIAGGEFFACLDADSFVDKNALKRMLFTFQEGDERLAIVTPAMKVTEPKNFLQKLQRAEYLSAILINRITGYINSIYVAPGPFSVYRTDIIKKIGGFDENNLTEDQEIAYRAQQHNYKIGHCPDGFVYTLAPKNARDLYKQRNRWMKGGIFNALKYKSLTFNKKYGDFGLFQMPSNFFNFILGGIAVFFVVYYSVIPIFRNLRHLYLIGFDIVPYFRNFRLTINLLDINLPFLMFMVLLFVLIVILFILAHHNARESARKYGFFYMAPYFFVYYIIMSFVVLIAAVELLFGRKQKW